MVFIEFVEQCWIRNWVWDKINTIPKRAKLRNKHVKTWYTYRVIFDILQCIQYYPIFNNLVLPTLGNMHQIILRGQEVKNLNIGVKRTLFI